MFFKHFSSRIASNSYQDFRDYAGQEEIAKAIYHKNLGREIKFFREMCASLEFLARFELLKGKPLKVKQ